MDEFITVDKAKELFERTLFAINEHHIEHLTACVNSEMRGLVNHMSSSVYEALSLSNFDIDGGLDAIEDADISFEKEFECITEKVLAIIQNLVTLRYAKDNYIHNAKNNYLRIADVHRKVIDDVIENSEEVKQNE